MLNVLVCVGLFVNDCEERTRRRRRKSSLSVAVTVSVTHTARSAEGVDRILRLSGKFVFQNLDLIYYDASEYYKSALELKSPCLPHPPHSHKTENEDGRELDLLNDHGLSKSMPYEPFLCFRGRLSYN